MDERDPDPGFLERGGLRRRLRFLRKTRELAYRDLGGLVFEMHRLGQQREDLLQAKLATLKRIDDELSAIERALGAQRGVTVLREAGVTACPRCAAIHGSEDRFCPACGFSIGRHADRPIAAQPVVTPVGAAASATAPATTAPAAAPPTPPTLPVSAPAQQASTPTPPPVAPPPAQSPNATPSPAVHRPPPSPSPSKSQPASARAPFPPPAREPQPSGGSNSDDGRDQPTEVIDPPTQIVRPGQPER